MSMNVGAIMKALMGDASPSDSRALELRIGQIVRGVLLLVLDGGEALLQIGGVQVRAQMSADLPVGRSTLLQVQPQSTGGQIVLKPLADSTELPDGEALQDAVRSFGLPSQKWSLELLQGLKRDGYPIDKETAGWFKQAAESKPAGVDAQEWMNAAGVAFRRGLAPTETTVASLRQALYGPPVHERLAGLQKLLADYLGQAGGSAAAAASQGAAGAAQGSAAAAKAAQLLSQGSALLAAGSQALLAAPRSSGTAAAGGGYAAAAEAAASPAELGPQAGALRADAGGPAAAVRQQANAEEAASGSGGRQSAAAAQTAGGQASTLGAAAAAAKGEPPFEAVARGAAAGAAASNAKGNGDGAAVSTPSSSSASAMASASAARSGALAAEAPPTEASWIGRFLQLLGVEHERQAAALPIGDGSALPDGAPNANHDAGQDFAKAGDTLKSALLTLASSDDVPAPLREAAHAMAEQITGQQLLLASDKTNTSPMSHFTIFVPMKGQDGDTTATIHVQTRKGRKGEWDTSNCRLLFDLRMSHLGDTVVDVQVVDKVVSLKLMNDRPWVAEMIEAARGDAAAGLRAAGFQLLSLKAVPFPAPVPADSNESGTAQSSGARIAAEDYAAKPYKGVDYRA